LAGAGSWSLVAGFWPLVPEDYGLLLIA